MRRKIKENDKSYDEGKEVVGELKRVIVLSDKNIDH